MKLETTNLVDYRVSKNFVMDEFKCKCGCKTFKLDSKLVDLLQVMRTKVGKPIRVLSGYRCPTHNAKVGGSTNSQHIHGTACDIAITGMSVYQMALLAEQVGFDGIGKYYNQNFIHVDVRGTKARWTE